MHRILRLGERLFVDLESGRCRRTRQASSGEAGEKLTHGQLRILNCLVENRENVCGNSVLEGLFDGSLGEDQTAGIKQQIQRIKNKFRNVDGSFDSRRAKYVFQAVPRVGYMFHLPEDGEILEAGLPVNALRCLDAEWFAGIRKLGEEERKEIREAFDRMDGSWENTLRACALGMCVHNAAMRRQLRDFSEYVFREDGARGVVSVVSVGAEGKTVLLAEFARMCAEDHPNWNVYEMDLSSIEPSPEAMREIMDYLRQKGIGKIRRNILLLDAPDVLDRRFGYFLHMIQEINQPWLYVVLTGRLYTATLAFQQPWLSDYKDGIRVYLLDPEARAKMPDGPERTFYRRNEDGTKTKIEIDWEKIEEIRAKERLEKATDYLVAVPSVSVKKEVMAGIVERCYAPWEEIREALVKRLPELPYEERSFIDLYLMLLGQAGRMSADKRTDIMGQNACRGCTAWDRWRAVTGFLDQHCIGYRTISEMFPYMAVMWIFKIQVDIRFLCRATGWENERKIQWMLDRSVGNEIFTGEGKKILPPDRDVLYACFYMHPEISAERCLQEIFQSSWLDGKMLENVVSATFLKFMHLNVDWIPFSIDMLKLAKITLRNPLYTKMLAERRMADVPELAALWFSYEPGIFQGTLSRTAIAFSVAFGRVTEEEPREIVRIFYWLRFLEVAVYYFQSVPDFLMDFFTDQDERVKKKMLTGAENDLKNGRYYREKFWNTQMEHYLEELRNESDKEPEHENGETTGEMPGEETPEEGEKTQENAGDKFLEELDGLQRKIAEVLEGCDWTEDTIIEFSEEGMKIQGKPEEFSEEGMNIQGKTAEKQEEGERNPEEGTGNHEEGKGIPEKTAAKEPAGNTVAVNNGRPPVKNRLLNALLGKREKQLQHLNEIAAEEKELFDLLDARARGEGIDRLGTEGDEDNEMEMEELSCRVNRVLTKYMEFCDMMEAAGEQEGVMLVTGRWSMFCYRLGLLEQAHDILAHSVRILPESLEGMYWTFLMQGRVAEAGGPQSPGEAPENTYYSPEEAERYYRKAYANYLRYGNQNDLEPFVAILETLAAFYYKQGKTNKEEKIYAELETRIPSSRIRDEVHGCLID